jgi:hypothetical protein
MKLPKVQVLPTPPHLHSVVSRDLPFRSCSLLGVTNQTTAQDLAVGKTTSLPFR